MSKLRAAIACLLALPILSQAVETNPVGFISITVPPASDVALGVPLGRPNEFQGVIESISGNTITLSGSPAWTASQFKYASGTQSKTYYLQIDSGKKEGLVLPITDNGSSTVTVTLPDGEDLSDISTNQSPVAPLTAGEVISIAPYWTLSSLVPTAIAGTNILMFPTQTVGINVAPTIYFTNGSSWFTGVTPANDVCIVNQQGFILRNNSTTSSQIVTITGAVPMTSHRLRLKTLAANTRQDIRFFYNSPVPELIGNVISSTSLTAGDQLLFTDNTATGKNKSPTTLFWSGTGWFQGVTPVSNTFTLQPGWSYVIRKVQTTNPASVVWTSLQSYLQ